MSTPVPESHGTIRSTSGVVGVVISAAVGVFLLGDAVVRGSWGTAMQFAPWVLLILWAIWIGMGASFLRLDDDAAHVQNLLRRHRVPWGRVQDVTVRYQVVLVTEVGRIPCMGGPAAGRPGIARKGPDGGPATRVPPLLRVEGQVRDVWEHRRHSAGAQGPVTHSWDWPMIAIFAVLLLWGLLELVVR